MRCRRIHRRSDLAARLSAETHSPLEGIFGPNQICVIGVNEVPGDPGLRVLEHLATGNAPVHVVRAQVKGAPAGPTEILGRPVVSDPADIPTIPDLAILTSPASEVADWIRACGDAGIRSALVLSEGFREVGIDGKKMEEEVHAAALESGLRILGPGSLGVMVPRVQLNASLVGPLARAGSVAFLSESGALVSSVLDWSRRENVGFSALVSSGGLLDIGWGDLIYHFGDDPYTRSIVIYMETVGEARKLLSAAREVALSKPVIVLKVGRTGAAEQSASSHSGALAGSDEVLDAAFRRAGVLRVDTVAELFDMAEVLGKQARPSGPRLAIVTNAGGPGALAADALVAAGGEVAELGAPAKEALHRLLPGRWSGGNPVDIHDDATPSTFARAVEALGADDSNDGVLVVLAPQVATDPKGTAEALAHLARPAGKPILTSWMGGNAVAAAQTILNGAGFPTADYPDDAARAFCHMWRYSYALRGIYETPAQVADLQGQAPDRKRVADVLAHVRASDRTLLTEVESKQLLASYGIPVSPTHVAFSENDVVRIANKLGYPVVVKLHSETLTHKTEVGGVQLNLRNPVAVREAWRSIEATVTEKAHRSDFLGVTVQPMVVHNGYELLLGSSLDEQFGPVLVFGTGGALVEIFRDRALAIPPLNATLALRLMEQTRIFQALRGGRGRKPVDLSALEALLVRFSYLVIEQPEIAEIDINPLIVADNTLVAVDARVILHPPDLDLSTLPRSAIRPYPNQYVTRVTLKDGTPVTIRPIRPEDEPHLVEFHKTLSDRTVYNRYFVPLKLSERIAHERLVRVCFSDYDRDIPLVAEFRASPTAPPQIIGIGRLGKEHQINEGEFALIISDAWQGRGLGRQLLEILIQVARDERLTRLSGHILGGNREMQAVCRKLGFTFHHHHGDSECIAEFQL
jgi:acetyltransferase